MAFETIESTQTDPGSPVDKQLMDQGLRLNMDALNSAISNIGGVPTSFFVVNDDCDGAIDSTDLRFGVGRWNYGVSGASAAFTTTGAPSDNQHIGVYSLVTGTDTTGSVLLGRGAGSFFVANGEFIFETLIRLADLSTAAQEYAVFFGISDAPTNLSPNNGIYIKYVRGTSVNWIYNSRSGGTGTDQTSSIPVTEDAWWRLQIVVNAGGTSITFYAGVAGGALTALGTVTTNISAVQMIPTLRFVKSAGTTSRTMYVDWLYLSKAISGGR